MREGEIILTLADQPGAHLASYTMGIRSFPGGIALGVALFTLPPPSSVEVKERVEAYLYSCVSSWPVIVLNSPHAFISVCLNHSRPLLIL